MTKPMPDWTDEELIKAAQDGQKGAGAAIEAMRRLRRSLDGFKESSDTYSKRMWWLTVVLALLTLLQLVAVVRHW